MTNQLQGEVLFAGWTGSTDDANWAYTPWMPVRGDVGTFGVELIANKTATLEWEVQTRDRDDPTAISEIVTGVTALAAPGLSIETSGPGLAKELVRYRFATGAGSANTTDYVHFRALQPSWQVDR